MGLLLPGKVGGAWLANQTLVYGACKRKITSTYHHS
uniref:Uncharacterized protein n=1 Tax=Anguilla anguilla TaxID=7936 RepID=A0A0E9Q8M6_ANGAN